jgi:hypothetical protein
MPTLRPHSLRRAGLVALALATVTALAAGPAVAGAQAGGVRTTSSFRPAAPPTPRHEPAAVEAFAPDQAQFFCRRTVEPGVKAFETLVLATYRGTASDGDLRACDDGGTSEHKDGRAWDWGADHRNAKQRAAGKSLLKWLFATDAHSQRDAMFRRLGLMYVIWDKRIWGTWSQSWQPYSCSGVTACHVDHMHFSFSWAGAEKKTSFWTREVSGVVEPPLPSLTHGHRTLHVTAAAGEATAHWLVKQNATYRATTTGTWRQGGTRYDARCVKKARGWTPVAGGGVTVGGDQLQGWGEQWVPIHGNPGGCDSSHTYRLVLTPSAPSTVTVTLPRGHGAASGRLSIRFTRTA